MGGEYGIQMIDGTMGVKEGGQMGLDQTLVKQKFFSELEQIIL